MGFLQAIHFVIIPALFDGQLRCGPFGSPPASGGFAGRDPLGIASIACRCAWSAHADQGPCRPEWNLQKGIIMIFAKTSLASILALAVMASPVALTLASAQQQEQQQQQETEAAPAPGEVNLDDAKLRSFVVAFLEVNKVAQTYKPQLQAAENEEDQQRIQAEASRGMTQAVESTQGISVEEYNAIITTAQTNPEVAEQINTLIREAAEPEQ
jgi:hypothetical protein